MEQRRRIERAWVKGLSEIVQSLIWLLDEHGRDTHTEEEWANCRGKNFEASGLIVSGEGNEEGGPYRLEVYPRTIDDGMGDLSEPFLRLKIRPGTLWVNEVKALLADPSKLEKAKPVGV